MLRFLADENFNGDITRGLLLRRAELDIVRVQDVGLAGTKDPEILSWAADHQRILLTHDRATIPAFAFERLASGESIAGIFVLNDRLPVRAAIDVLLLYNELTEPSEFQNRVEFLHAENSQV